MRHKLSHIRRANGVSKSPEEIGEHFDITRERTPSLVQTGGPLWLLEHQIGENACRRNQVLRQIVLLPHALHRNEAQFNGLSRCGRASFYSQLREQPS